MKKNDFSLLVYFLLFSLSLTFVACSEDDDDSVQYAVQNIAGRWMSVTEDGNPILTDDCFVMTYNADGTSITWAKNIDGAWKTIGSNYSLNGDRVTVTGDNGFYLAIEIDKLDAETLVYTELEKRKGGVDEALHAYSLKKVGDDVDMTGLWYGKDDADEDISTNYKYWRYNPDGTFEYYYFDTTTGGYVKKEDNNGTYRVFGELFVSNYVNDAESDARGMLAENWIVSVEGDTMRWSGSRVGGAVATFTLVRRAQDDDMAHYSVENIAGRWMGVTEDGNPILTDDCFVMTYNADGTSITWAKNIDGAWKTIGSNYSLKGNRVTVTGDNGFYLALKIDKLDAETLLYTELEKRKGGVDEPLHAYSLKKVGDDADIIGLWYGKDDADEESKANYKYWRYNADGSYDYFYYVMENGEYSLKEDNSGTYYIYGNLLVSNYVNDVESGEQGKLSENMMISLEGKTMKFSGLREDGKTSSFTLEKCESNEPER